MLSGDNNECFFVGYSEAIEVFTLSGIPHLVPLWTGGLNQALNYPAVFESTIPALFGLPPLDSPNPAEGEVSKPFELVWWTKG